MNVEKWDKMPHPKLVVISVSNIMRVYYSDGAVMYNTAHEATTNIMKRGLSVDMKDRATLLDQIRQQTWQTSAKKKQ